MNNLPSQDVIICRQLSKSYRDANVRIDVLQAISFTVRSGESVAIIGTSGSGKSTLLHLLGGLDSPDSGEVILSGKLLARLSEGEKSVLRNSALGFVYQFHHLLPEFTALENVAMPLLIRGLAPSAIYPKAKKLLADVGLSGRLQHKPAALSGGERQRVAIARALVTEPLCLLADEPTGNLDPHNAEIVLNLFVELQKSCQTALVMVTHDAKIAERLQHRMLLEQGRLVEGR